jgi:MFS family permease
MKSFNHLITHFRTYGIKHKFLYSTSLMLFFWSIFDGIITYVTPLVITESGYSNTIMGIIIGSSSIAGALFDFLLSKYLQTSSWRRLYLIMFAVCFVYPLILWQSKIIFIYLIAMALWGLYYDLLSFGNFDFVSREMQTDENASSFGVMGVFKSAGYLLAPLIVGLVIAEFVDWKPFVLAWIFLIIAFIIFIGFYLQGKKRGVKQERLPRYRPKGFLVEINLWKKIGKILLPFLSFTMLMSMHDSFFWTIGPILSQTFVDFKPLDGLFLTAFSLPPLIVGWFVDKFQNFLGDKANFKSYIISSIFLISFAFFRNPLVLLFIILISSTFSTFTWAIEQGMYADRIEDAFNREKEIAGLVDFSVNLGYIFGPILAGFLSDKVGYFNTFALLGIFGLLVTLILSKISPRKIVLTG